MAHVHRRKVTGILLAGGASSRMGKDKALLDFAGLPMIAWCAAALAECTPNLIVSSSTEGHARACARAVEGAWPRFTVLRGARVGVAVDLPGGQGPLAGLAAGFSAASTEAVVLSACDTPLVPAAFYRKAVVLLGPFQAVAPLLDAPEPLTSAWLREPALASIGSALSAGRGPRALLEAVKGRLVERAELAAWGLDSAHFASANTPAARDRLLALQAGEKGEAARSGDHVK